VPDRHTYDYTIIRVVPRVEREEFVNVGVIVSCPGKKFLEAQIALDEKRLQALDPSVDLDSVRAHLEAIPRICAGGKNTGTIGALSQRERFYWLSAPKSTMIQSSPVHTGLCEDPAEALENLVKSRVLSL
jgi:hypothetical protein